MKKKKLTAAIISTAIGISTVIPAGISEITTYADTSNKLGDVNNDDAVDANDSSIVLEEYSLLSTGKDSNLNDNQKKSADVDKNGEIDASDATIILSYYSYVSTGGQLDIEQFIEIMFENPVQSTTTTTTTSKTTANTTTSTSKTTEKTTTSTSKTTASTTTSTSKTTASTTTSISKTTEKTTTTTSNPTTTSTTTSTLTETTTSTTITDSNKVSEIILNSNEINIGVGQSERITDIKVIPQNAVNQEMKWTSSDDSIAIVNNLGWIIGKKAGQCKIIIQSADNPNVFAVIIVNVTDGEPITTTSTSETTTTTVSTTTETTTSETTTTTNIKVTGISVSQNSFTISVGGKNIPIVTMYPANASDKGEIWVSSDEKVATVDKYGWIKGISVGECKVTVYSASDPSVFAEIEVKVVDEDIPTPEFNFSYVLGDKSDAKNLAFYTPIPKDVSGRFNIDYVITDANGKITKMTYTIFAPEMNSIVTPLTAETNNFTVSTYITNLETDDTAQIGTYEFSINPRDAKTITENIPYAFSIIGGLNK